MIAATDDTITVFAFGSNLCRAQMSARCPSARFFTRATLHGHKLVFVGYSALWGGAVATVRRSDTGRVLGALYELTERDLLRLDGYEAGYRRSRRTVDVPRIGGIKAHLYVRDHVAPASPSDAYLDAIARGYQALGYSLDELVAYRTRERVHAQAKDALREARATR